MPTNTASFEAPGLPAPADQALCPECAQAMYRCAVTAITTNPVSVLGSDRALSALLTIGSRSGEAPGWLHFAAMCDCGWQGDWHDARALLDADD